jgi:DNA-directed RNA polymerase specialized sigma24 family protein
MTRMLCSPGETPGAGCEEEQGAAAGAEQAGAAGQAEGRSLEETFARSADGLFTYCLSVLCDHDQAVAAVAAARELAVRHRRRLRRPELLRAWLYALARQACLRLLETGEALDALGAGTGGDGGEPGGAAADAPPAVAGAAGGSAEEAGGAAAGWGGGRRAELGALVWPEAAGTTPEQREALELAGRHGLETPEIAAVLGLGEEAAAALLAQAACEVERTSAALAVLAAGACPVLTVLGGGSARSAGPGGALLGPALRGELVRHVDDCPTCRGGVERAAAAGPWPGTLRAAGRLPLVPAPPALRAGVLGPAFRAGATAGRHRRRGGAPPDPAPARRVRPRVPEPRFDRRGFPVHRPVNAERAAQLRQRALTTTVIAAVVAAPVLTLWASHRGGPPRTGPVSAVGAETTPEAGPNAAESPPPPSATGSTRSGSGSIALAAARPPDDPGRRPAPAPGRLSAEAAVFGGRAVLTLANTGGAPLSWQAVSDAGWVRLSRECGVLQPGQRVTVVATVDETGEPNGPWTAHVALRPSGQLVTLTGPGARATASPSPGPGRRSGPPPRPAPSPSPTGPSASPSPTPTPTTAPTPTPAPTPSASASADPLPDGPSPRAGDRDPGSPGHVRP